MSRVNVKEVRNLEMSIINNNLKASKNVQLSIKVEASQYMYVNLKIIKFESPSLY